MCVEDLRCRGREGGGRRRGVFARRRSRCSVAQQPRHLKSSGTTSAASRLGRVEQLSAIDLSPSRFACFARESDDDADDNTSSLPAHATPIYFEAADGAGGAACVCRRVVVVQCISAGAWSRAAVQVCVSHHLTTEAESNACEWEGRV